MNIKVNTSIELNRARVELTSDQKEKVEAYVTQLLTGEHKERKVHQIRSKHNPLGSRPWTREEESKFMELYRKYAPTVRTQDKLMQVIGRELGRTSQSCSLRLSNIRRGKGILAASEAPGKTGPHWKRNMHSEIHPASDRPTHEHQLEAR